MAKPQSLGDDFAAVAFTWQFTEHAGISCFRDRPCNDNSQGRGEHGTRTSAGSMDNAMNNAMNNYKDNSMGNSKDNMDVFMLSLPLTFAGNFANVPGVSAPLPCGGHVCGHLGPCCHQWPR